MPRKARKLCDSGIYHVMLKGIGEQLLFEDEKDNKKMLQIIKRYKYKLGCEIYAYVFMDNHVHLLLRDINNCLSDFMKRIEISYVSYFNKKYDRTGPLFHDRFKSEIVDNDRYFLSAARYIMKNPDNAGICDFDTYKWSSYSEYIGRTSIVDTQFLLSIIQNSYGEYELIDFLNLRDEIKHLEIKDSPQMSDRKVIMFIKRLLHISNTLDLIKYETKIRNYNLQILKKAGIPIRQISRLTGISPGIVRRA